MIKKTLISLLSIIILSCSNIDLVLKESSSPNHLKNNVLVVVDGEEKQRLERELRSFFGNNKKNEYILTVLFVENKENRLVKQNQVAEKINYELDISYGLFYKNRECKILDKKIITKFTISPKSFGYNFGTDRSLEKLYISSINKNILNFINTIPTSTDCLK